MCVVEVPLRMGLRECNPGTRERYRGNVRFPRTEQRPRRDRSVTNLGASEVPHRRAQGAGGAAAPPGGHVSFAP